MEYLIDLLFVDCICYFISLFVYIYVGASQSISEQIAAIFYQNQEIITHTHTSINTPARTHASNSIVYGQMKAKLATTTATSTIQATTHI